MQPRSRPPIIPLTEEPPVPLRPKLAEAVGLHEAMLIDRVWEAAQLPAGDGGRPTCVHEGRLFVSYPMRLAIAALGMSKGEAHRTRKELVRLGILIQRELGTGRDSKSWLAVDTAAVQRACPLYRAAAPLQPTARATDFGPNLGPKRSQDGTESPEFRSQVGTEVKAVRSQIGTETAPALLDTLLFSSHSYSLTPSLAREGGSDLEGGEDADDADAADPHELLRALGFDADEVANEIARYPDGAKRARTMAQHVQALRAAGYPFDPWPPFGYVVQGMRGNWPALTPAAAAARVAALRRKEAKRPRTLRERIEAARDGLATTPASATDPTAVTGSAGTAGVEAMLVDSPLAFTPRAAAELAADPRYRPDRVRRAIQATVERIKRSDLPPLESPRAYCRQLVEDGNLPDAQAEELARLTRGLPEHEAEERAAGVATVRARDAEETRQRKAVANLSPEARAAAVAAVIASETNDVLRATWRRQDPREPTSPTLLAAIWAHLQGNVATATAAATEPGAPVAQPSTPERTPCAAPTR